MELPPTSSQASTAADSTKSSSVELEGVDFDLEFAECVARLEQHWPVTPIPSSVPLLTSLGRYEIKRELGRGRFGVVFLARDPQLNRDVALKIQQFDAAMDPELRERFRGEALSAGQLQHPGIVRVYDVGQASGIDYLAMAFIDGMTLADRLKLGLLPSADAARLTASLAEAIHYAHEQGIVHRDLKPSNILLDKAEQPYVMDFGLARRMSDSVMRATMTGQVLGTPNYMSPEQATGRSDIGPLSDVYSLGVVLYEMLTGRPPFQAATFVEAVEYILNRDPIPPNKLNPKVSRELNAIALKCLEKHPPHRYASAAELADDLQRSLDGRPIRARTQGPVQQVVRWCRKHPTLSLLVVAAAMMLGLMLTTASVYSQLQHADELAKEHKKIADTQQYYVAVTDAKNAAAAQEIGWTKEAQTKISAAVEIDSQSTNSRELRTIATASLTGVDVFPDGSYDTRMLIGRIAISPDGKLLAIGELKGNSSCQVVVYDLAARKTRHAFNISVLAGNLNRMRKGEVVRFQDGVREFAFSGDSRFLAVGMRFGAIHCYDLQDPKAPPKSLVTTEERELGRIQFSHDNKSIFAITHRNSVFLRWPNWQTEPPHDDPLEGHTGDLVAAPHSDRLFVQNHAGTNLRMLNSKLEKRENYDSLSHLFRGSDFNLTTNGDGRLLAGESEIGICVYDTNSGYAVRRMKDDRVGTESAADELQMSTDGQLLSAYSDKGSLRLFDVPSGLQILRLTLGRHDFQDVALDPLKRWVVVANDSQLEFWKLELPTIRQTINQATEQVEDFRFSPDSRSLATTSTAAGSHSFVQKSLRTYNCATAGKTNSVLVNLGTHGFIQGVSQVEWSANDELIWHSGLGTTCHRAHDLSLAEQHGVLPLFGAAVATEFAVRGIPAKKVKEPAAFEKSPRPLSSKRQVSRAAPRNQAFRISGKLPRTSKPETSIALLLIALKLDSSASLKAPFTMTFQAEGVTEVHDAPVQILDAGRDAYTLCALVVPNQIRAFDAFDLTITPAPSVRGMSIERIHYVEQQTVQPSTGRPSLVDLDYLTLNAEHHRLWGIADNQAQSWHWPTGDSHHAWTNPKHATSGAGNIRCVVTAHQGTAVGTRDGKLHWLDPETGVARAEWETSGREVVAAVLCEAAKMTLVACENGKVCAVGVPSGEILFEFPAHKEAVVAIAATPDGERLITASADRHLKLWRKSPGGYDPYCSLPNTLATCRKVRISNDGKFLAVLCRGTESVELWNLAALMDKFVELKID